MGQRLVDAFRAGRDGGEAAPGLEARLQEIVARARARWPKVTLDAERFARRLGESLPPEGDAEELLAARHADDLYLTTACSDGDADALAALDGEVLTHIGEHVGRVDRSPHFADEVRQRVREALLVGKPGERPAIASFAGRGPLLAWVRVVALRTALELRRQQGDVQPAAEDEARYAEAEPELAYIQQRYRDDFRDAFHQALGSLAAAERRLLRMHFLDGLSLAQIGAIERLDKSNVSRRLAAIRATILERTRRRLVERLRIDASELDSLIGVMQSQLDVSIERVLLRTGK